jgi:hypothetical protein
MAAKITKAPAAPPSTGSQVVTLRPPAESPQSVRYEPSPPFLLVWAPLRYQLDADGEIIPQLGKMPIEPGINGVNARGGYAVAKAAQAERGRLVLDPGEHYCTAADTPDGQPGYLRATQTAAGPYHHTPWERLEVHAGQGTIIEHDPEGYRAWLRALVDRGHIPEVHPSVVARLRDRTEATLDSASARGESRGQKAAVELAKRQLDALDKRAGGAA